MKRTISGHFGRTAIGVALVILLASCGSPSAGDQSVSADEADVSSSGDTLTSVRARGYIICGASQGTVGFGMPDDNGYWRGLDVETCRAVAAAVLGDKDSVRFAPLTGQQRITALQTGEIDLLPRTTTWTLSRDANGINFTGTNFYDFTGVLVRKDAGAKVAQDLKGASVCVQTGSTSEITLADISFKYDLKLRPVIFDSVQATRQSFFSGRCDALISDASAMASVRATMAENPADYTIIKANDSISALSPAVRHGDDQWFDIVKWSFQAMLMAEHLGINQANVDEMLESDSPPVRRFLGTDPGAGRALGLSDDFAYQIVKQVGNYADLYERNVGSGSRLKIERGLNSLQRDGGLMLPLSFD